MSNTLVDGHVHFHSCFSLSAFLDAAERNFARTEDEYTAGVLLLTNTGQQHPLEPILLQADGLSAWSMDSHENTSVVFSQAATKPIILITGFQIVTREGLEVLSLCTDTRVAQQQSIAATVQQVFDSGGVPVVPWAFGKWSFQRGKVLRDFLLQESGAETNGKVLLGDNGCRPQAWRPTQLKRAIADGFAVLAGSDPLPIHSHVRATFLAQVVR